jgi:hypothetical protein
MGCFRIHECVLEPRTRWGAAGGAQGLPEQQAVCRGWPLLLAGIIFAQLFSS